jgi:hypothetical protein
VKLKQNFISEISNEECNKPQYSKKKQRCKINQKIRKCERERKGKLTMDELEPCCPEAFLLR